MPVRKNARGRVVRGRLQSTLRAVGGRAAVVVLGAVIGILAAVINIELTPKSYEATSQVFVTVSSVTDASQLYNGDQFTLSRVQSYINIVDSPNITGPVSDQLNNQLSQRQVADRVSADAPLNKVIINIHARDGSAKRAARIANLVATQFTKTVQRIETAQRIARSQSAQSPVKLTITNPADAPESPVAPQTKLLLLAGFLGGAVLGLLVVVLRDRLLRRVRTPRDLETLLSTPPLGVVPKDRRSDREPNAFRSSQSARAEAFRQLRTNLQFVDVDNPPKIIAVTSPLGSEGKTSVALNLSVALAEARVSVALVETDLRQPVLADILELDDAVGLTSVLIGSATIDDVIQRDQRGLAVITSGPKPFNPSELLASQQARAAIAEIAERFDYVILDAVSMLPLADGAETASLADTTVLVGWAGRTSPDNIRASIGAISRVGGTFAGVVLNAASGSRWIASDRPAKPAAKTKPLRERREAQPDDGLSVITDDDGDTGDIGDLGDIGDDAESSNGRHSFQEKAEPAIEDVGSETEIVQDGAADDGAADDGAADDGAATEATDVVEPVAEAEDADEPVDEPESERESEATGDATSEQVEATDQAESAESAESDEAAAEGSDSEESAAEGSAAEEPATEAAPPASRTSTPPPRTRAERPGAAARKVGKQSRNARARNQRSRPNDRT